MRRFLPLCLLVGCMALRGQWSADSPPRSFDGAPPCKDAICVAPKIRPEGTVRVLDIVNQSDVALQVRPICCASLDPEWVRIYPVFTLPPHTGQTALVDDDAVWPCKAEWGPPGSLHDE